MNSTNLKITTEPGIDGMQCCVQDLLTLEIKENEYREKRMDTR